MKIYNNTEIEELSKILKNDGVIAVPTDTVYGICARMNSKKARENLIEIKNRPENKAFPIMCNSIDQIKSIAKIDERIEKIINAFMPGPITLVLLKGEKVPSFINEGSNEIGVRMATSKALEEVIEKVGSPIFMTSANISGNPVCQTIEEIKKTFPNIDGIMDGKVSYGQASTIVDCTTDEIKIIREGPIELEDILEQFEN